MGFGWNEKGQNVRDEIHMGRDQNEEPNRTSQLFSDQIRDHRTRLREFIADPVCAHEHSYPYAGS